MANIHRAYSAFACFAIVGLAAVFFWPRETSKVLEAETILAREIQLVSPDGRRTIRLSVTNSSANICAQRTDGRQMILLSSSDFGDQIQLGNFDGEHAVMRLTNINEPRIGAKPGASIRFFDPHGGPQKVLLADSE